MSSKSLRHLRIIANAGSGKTYRLVTRYIELLARGEPPERIMALTFTRKAAGEFLDSIFKRLLTGTASPEGALLLGEAVGVGEISQARCVEFLRLLVDNLHRLTLGTLDSFFGRVVRAFPFECGLAGEITLLDGHLQSQLNREVLQQVVAAAGRDSDGSDAFFETIRQINRNREERSVLGSLESQVRALHEKFLLTPPGIVWGNPKTIWPRGCDLMRGGNAVALGAAFQKEVFGLHQDMDEKSQGTWEAWFVEIAGLQPGSVLSPGLRKFALQLITPKAAKKDPGFFELKAGRKAFQFPGDRLPPACALGQALMWWEIEGKLIRSLALYRFLARFERAYGQSVRDTGRLTFSDITALLAGSERAGGSTLHLDRRELDFRLDSSCDHWLLDEFQDTSRMQWSALRDLVDEVIQSDTGRRSFFYVGDTKQAIYPWRGGDARLFEEVADHYNSGGEQRIATDEVLSISYRSTPEILKKVNAVFAPESLAKQAVALELPDSVLQRWERAWSEHKPSDPRPERGFFQWTTVSAEEEGRNATLDRETARLIREEDPVSKGRTCAVLVRTNDRVASVIHALRQAGIPASEEGRFYPCVDNAAGCTLLSLLRSIAHPGDSFSRMHVLMSPLAGIVGSNPAAFREQALGMIATNGFAGAVATWLQPVRGALGDFGRSRAEDFLLAARAFDESYGGRAGIDDFVSFAENYEGRESPDDQTVRVMTVHASKGLDFDMVVLPDLEGDTLPTRKEDSPIFLCSGAEGRVLWGLDLPARDVCDAEETLRGAYQDDAAEQCYERLCFYYVAMTRARRALFLVTTQLGESSKARNFNRLLHETFALPEGGSLASGNAAWSDQP